MNINASHFTFTINSYKQKVYTLEEQTLYIIIYSIAQIWSIGKNTKKKWINKHVVKRNKNKWINKHVVKDTLQTLNLADNKGI